MSDSYSEPSEPETSLWTVYKSEVRKSVSIFVPSEDVQEMLRGAVSFTLFFLWCTAPPVVAAALVPGKLRPLHVAVAFMLIIPWMLLVASPFVNTLRECGYL